MSVVELTGLLGFRHGFMPTIAQSAQNEQLSQLAQCLLLSPAEQQSGAPLALPGEPKAAGASTSSSR